MALDVISAADGWLNPAEEVPWLIEGVLQKGGLEMIHGPEKQGKSMLLGNIALAGAFELPSYLGFPLRPGGFTTLMLQGEMHLYGFQQRLVRMLGPLRALYPDDEEFLLRLRRIHYNTVNNIAVLEPTAWAELTRWCGNFRPDIVMIDPYAHVMQGDENSNEAVGAVLQHRFGYLSREFGCAVVFTHHNGKVNDSYGRPAQQQSRGANRFTADPDFIWSVLPMRAKRRGAPPTITLKYTSRYSGGLSEPRVRLNPTTFWFEPFDTLDENAERTADAFNKHAPKEGLLPKDADAFLVEHNIVKAEATPGHGRHRTAKRILAHAAVRGLIRADDQGQGNAALRYFAAAPAAAEEGSDDA